MFNFNLSIILITKFKIFSYSVKVFGEKKVNEISLMSKRLMDNCLRKQIGHQFTNNLIFLIEMTNEIQKNIYI